jgi:hypothetical protein
MIAVYGWIGFLNKVWTYVQSSYQVRVERSHSLSFEELMNRSWPKVREGSVRSQEEDNLKRLRRELNPALPAAPVNEIINNAPAANPPLPNEPLIVNDNSIIVAPGPGANVDIVEGLAEATGNVFLDGGIIAAVITAGLAAKGFMSS